MMKALKAPTWQHEKTGYDGYTTLFGVNIFSYDWKRTGRRTKVRDPLHGRELVFDIYTVSIDGQEREFAAGEFSNCCWGFYLLKY